MAGLTLHPEEISSNAPLGLVVKSSHGVRVGMPRRSNRTEDRKKETASTLAAWHNAGTLPSDPKKATSSNSTQEGVQEKRAKQKKHTSDKGKAFALKSYPQKT